MIGRSNVAGGSGGKITVTSEGNATATVSNELLGRSITKPVSSGRPAVFANLAEGDWMVTTDNGSGEPQIHSVSIILSHTVRVTFFTAFVAVTYPVGSVCTASLGSYLFTAPDTSGRWDLTVPVEGTWTISCTDGYDSAETSVSVVTDGQMETVSLSYNLILYSPGDEHSAVTGGWVKYRNATLAKNAEYLRIVPTQKYDANSALVGTANKIDLTSVSTLTAKAWNNCAADEYLGFGICSEKTGDFIADTYWNANENKARSLNVAKYSGSYYVRFVVFYGDAAKGDGRVYNVWGEK